MSVKTAFKHIMENNLDKMRESFHSALTSKAVQKLEEKKQTIAKSYFGKK